MSKLLMFSIVLFAGCVLWNSNAFAGLVNGGFESPVVANPPDNYLDFSGGQNIDGWTVVGSDVLIVNSDRSELANGVTAFNAHSGNQHLDLTGAGNTGTADGVFQTIQTVVGHAYEISFFVGRADGNSLYSTPSTLDLSVNGGARISFTNANATPGFVNWQEFTTTFTATSSSTSIAFYNGTPAPSQFGGDNNYVGLDDVEVRDLATVPEPSSLLLGLGGIGMGLTAWRRKRLAAT